jgi:ribosomal-protein-alanine N-acetyltransferase
MRYWNFPASKTVAETERALGWLAKTSSPYDHLAWTVADPADNQCIGMVNYHHREVRNRRLEIGYIIGRKHQGKGLQQRLFTHELATHRMKP